MCATTGSLLQLMQQKHYLSNMPRAACLFICLLETLLAWECPDLGSTSEIYKVIQGTQ